MKQYSETVAVWNYQNADRSLENKFIVLFITIFGTRWSAIVVVKCSVYAPSASEVTTLRRYTNLFIIIIIIMWSVMCRRSCRCSCSTRRPSPSSWLPITPICIITSSTSSSSSSSVATVSSSTGSAWRHSARSTSRATSRLLVVTSRLLVVTSRLLVTSSARWWWRARTPAARQSAHSTFHCRYTVIRRRRRPEIWGFKEICKGFGAFKGIFGCKDFLGFQVLYFVECF